MLCFGILRSCIFFHMHCTIWYCFLTSHLSTCPLSTCPPVLLPSCHPVVTRRCSGAARQGSIQEEEARQVWKGPLSGDQLFAGQVGGGGRKGWGRGERRGCRFEGFGQPHMHGVIPIHSTPRQGVHTTPCRVVRGAWRRYESRRKTTSLQPWAKGTPLERHFAVWEQEEGDG